MLTKINNTYKATKNYIENHLIIFLIFFVLSMFIGTLLQKIVDNIVNKFMPEMDDTAQILKNQNEQFDVIKSNLSRLQGSLSGEGREAINSIEEAYKNAMKSSNQIAASYEIAKSENERLRKVLKNEKGLSAGYDILVSGDQGYRIDDAVNFGISYSNQGFADITLNSLKSSENIKTRLSSGQGVPYTNQYGKLCNLIFLGAEYSSNQYYSKFTKSCAK